MHKRQKYADLYIGLMSGTSLDAIDAALVNLPPDGSPQLIQAINQTIPPALRHEITQLCQPGDDEINRLGTVDRQIAMLFVEAVERLLELGDCPVHQIHAIGCHGQTIRHHPNRKHPFSLQIGDPNTLAFRTGIVTVADFRRMDIAANGQGAPLVPAFHAATLLDAQENRVVANIGGMANITLLATGRQVIGFDTGPGNILMDAWIQHCLMEQWDNNGNWAASGQLSPTLLAKLLSHPYLTLPAPKSTGREIFHFAWLKEQLAELGAINPVDVQRTLLEFTARSIVIGIQELACPVQRLLLCGGGAHNQALQNCLTTLLPSVAVSDTSAFGIDPDWMEAMAFAWLAKQRLEAKSGNLPSVTGASRPCILGGVYQPF